METWNLNPAKPNAVAMKNQMRKMIEKRNAT